MGKSFEKKKLVGRPSNSIVRKMKKRGGANPISERQEESRAVRSTGTRKKNGRKKILTVDGGKAKEKKKKNHMGFQKLNTRGMVTDRGASKVMKSRGSSPEEQVKGHPSNRKGENFASRIREERCRRLEEYRKRKKKMAGDKKQKRLTFGDERTHKEKIGWQVTEEGQGPTCRLPQVEKAAEKWGDTEKRKELVRIGDAKRNSN